MSDDQKIKEVEDRVQQLLDAAQQRSYEIIHEARDTAARIIEDAENISEELRNQYRNEFAQATERQNVAYEQLMQEIRNQALAAVQEMTTKLLTTFTQEITSFKSALALESQKAGQEMGKTLQQQWQSINESIEVYRKQRVANIDQEIQIRVDEIAKEVLGKSLTKSDQLSSIKQAIAEAKQKHGW